jgi:hypothetical protein
MVWFCVGDESEAAFGGDEGVEPVLECGGVFHNEIKLCDLLIIVNNIYQIILCGEMDRGAVCCADCPDGAQESGVIPLGGLDVGVS